VSENQKTLLSQAGNVILASADRATELLKGDVNDWFLKEVPGRQQVLVEDKWMLARNAYTAGIGVGLGEAAQLIDSIHSLANTYSPQVTELQKDLQEAKRLLSMYSARGLSPVLTEAELEEIDIFLKMPSGVTDGE